MLSTLLVETPHFLCCFTPTTLHNVTPSRTCLRISTVTRLEVLCNIKISEHVSVKGVIKDCFSSFARRCVALEVAKCYGLGSSISEDSSHNVAGNSGQAEESNYKNETNGPGNGDGNNDDNGNGNNNNNHPEEGHPESFNHERLTGLEWWWWWKFQQTRQSSSSHDNEHELWPFNKAVQVVSNGVKETMIKPVVRAIVLGPISKQVTLQGLLLCLVFGAFFVACVQMFAGLAMVSVGLSVAGLAGIVLGILWRTLKLQCSKDHRDHGDDDNCDL
ncbi:hypothetical protein vseg_007390 [Gypsophila vaccaria]